VNFLDFQRQLLQKPTSVLLREWLFHRRPHAFSTDELYERFVDATRAQFPTAEDICVAGTANWVFSLNPNKSFKEYGQNSDIDTVIIDRASFDLCWNEIRKQDRATKYTRAGDGDFLSASRNIYSGFVAPVWVLDYRHRMRFDFRVKLNQISNSIVNGREVKALFFKDREEVIDYYTRGVMLAKEKLK